MPGLGNGAGANGLPPTGGQAAKDPLLESMEQLRIGLRAIQDEQSYLLQREQLHHETASSTHSRILGWSMVQLVLLGGICYWQTYCLKRFFEVRRSI